jgi:hypothetical protein
MNLKLHLIFWIIVEYCDTRKKFNFVWFEESSNRVIFLFRLGNILYQTYSSKSEQEIVINQNTGRFIMLSVITKFYNKKTKVPTLKKLNGIDSSLAEVPVDFFGLCRKLDRNRSTSASAVNRRPLVFCLHRHPAAKMLTSMKNNFMRIFFLSCFFYLYKFRKYVPYGFPIINFCNREVHYETSCILRNMCTTICLLLTRRIGCVTTAVF